MKAIGGYFLIVVIFTVSLITLFTSLLDSPRVSSKLLLQDSDPILWLRFEGNLQDSSGNGLNFDCIPAGSTCYYAEGKDGQAFNLSGQHTPAGEGNGYAAWRPSSDIFTGLEQATITFWAKKHSADRGGYVYFSHIESYFSIGENSVSMDMYAGGERAVISGGAGQVNDNSWHQYALIYDGSKVEVYIDDISNKIGSATLSGTINDNPDRFYIGMRKGETITFNGLIDEFKVYDVALTPADIFKCTPGDVRPCELQDGVCEGSPQTCGADEIWPGCTEADYLAHNSSYEHLFELTCNDGSDNDCDGKTDNRIDPGTGQYIGDTDCIEGCVDLDGDGFAGSGITCNPLAPDYDCNDEEPSINPNATEICFNGIDENCNDVLDDGCAPEITGPHLDQQIPPVLSNHNAYWFVAIPELPFTIYGEKGSGSSVIMKYLDTSVEKELVPNDPAMTWDYTLTSTDITQPRTDIQLVSRDSGGDRAENARKHTLVYDPQPPVANITVEQRGQIIPPGGNVNIAEEVFISGWESTDNEFTKFGRFEWDFGDGYNFKYPYGGTIVSHFYMTPGPKTIQLELYDIAGHLDTETFTINIVGTPPSDKIDLKHADFHGHTAQYIYANISQIANADKFKATLLKNGAVYQTLSDVALTSLPTEIKFLLEQRNLPSGNYNLRTEVLDSGGNTLEFIEEYFEKPYDGIPKIGINEHNAIVIDKNGIEEPIYLVSIWGYSDKSIEIFFKNRYINTIFNFIHKPGINELRYYLDLAEQYNGYLMGSSYTWGAPTLRHFERNINISGWSNFVIKEKDYSPALIAWFWDDEPDLAGRDECNPAPVMRGVTYKSHVNDAHHLTVTGLTAGATGRTPPADEDITSKEHSYYYKYSKNWYGGKRQFVTDIYGTDYYPVDWNSAGSCTTIELLTTVLDNLRAYNYDLVPTISAIETCTVDIVDTPPPTPEQLKMLIWIHVVHGIKGINWFNYFDKDPNFRCYPFEDASGRASNPSFPVMKEFVQQITELQYLVLSPEPDRTIIRIDQANEHGNRVDVTIRENETDIWVFAVRINNIKPDGTSCEVDTLQNVQLSIEDIASSVTAEVYNESRTISVISDGTNGVITDDFGPYDVHIYKIPKAPPTEPIISVTPPSYGINFGEVEIGENSDETFTVRNAGVGTLEGEASTSAEPPFSIVSGGSYSLSAGQAQDVVVRFTPAEEGYVSATITFTGAGGTTRSLMGTGVITLPAEICNNTEDNDGDTLIGCADPDCLNQMGPDGYECICTDDDTRNCGTGEGICAPGTMLCIAGNWSGDCTGGISPCGGTWDNPAPTCQEDCNNSLDDNCDGQVNEGCACVENWVCSDWSDCVNDVRTRTCTDQNSCGTEVNKPATTTGCCLENWTCGAWSPCVNGTQTKICTDANDCGTVADKPETEQDCEEVYDMTTFWILIGAANIGIILVIIVAIYIERKHKRTLL